MGWRRGKNGQTLDLAPRLKRIPGDMGESLAMVADTIRYRDYEAVFDHGEALNGEDFLRVITRIEQDRFNLETLGNAFTPLRISIGTTPTLILPPNKTPRGYLFLNPNQVVSGVTGSSNAILPAVRGAGTIFSAQFNVAAYRTSRFFLDITAPAATLVVNLQTRDPQTGNWATAQSDIFGGAAAIGTYYADCGEIGTDDYNRLQVVQTGAGANYSITQLVKEAYSTTIAPPGIYLGNANVTTGIGYPLLGGQERKFFLMDNTPLYGVALAATTISVFQLQ